MGRSIRRARVVGLALGLVVASSTFVTWSSGRGAAEQVSEPHVIQSTSPRSIAALGHIEPRDGLIRIAGPGRPAAVIGLLHVAAGDSVEAGGMIAVLDDKPQIEALVERLRAEKRDADQQHERFRRLQNDGIVSVVELEAIQLRATVAAAEVRRAAAQLEQSIVRAPSAGTILDIYTRAGERIGADGVALLADTRLMDVLAEVYESDVPDLKLGAPATITSPVLVGPLRGRVERIGRLVGKQRAFDLNPAAAVDRRVVEVRITIDQPEALAAWSNLQVEVSIDCGRKES